MAYPPITVVVILVYHCIYAVLAANNNKTCLNNWTNLCNNCEKKKWLHRKERNIILFIMLLHFSVCGFYCDSSLYLFVWKNIVIFNSL